MITKEQIEQMNIRQNEGKYHPYTCDRKSNECEVHIEPRDYSKDGILIATEQGWICPCGKYKQSFEGSKLMTNEYELLKVVNNQFVKFQ